MTTITPFASPRLLLRASTCYRTATRINKLHNFSSKRVSSQQVRFSVSCDAWNDHVWDGHKVHITDGRVDVEDLARTVAAQKEGEDNHNAFFLVNLDAVNDRVELWRKFLPKVSPFYAMKCNTDPMILRVLATLGVNFDCCSVAEIHRVFSLGVSEDRIVYAHPYKTRKQIEFAANHGIQLMTFDSANELEKQFKIANAPGVLLRIAVSDTSARTQLSKKFGADPVNVAPDILVHAAEVGINVRGISFHIGSGAYDFTSIREGVEHASRLIEYGRVLGHRMDIVDIGGGFPGMERNNVPFHEIAEIINGAIFDFLERDRVKVIAEPGRFFAEKTMSLVTNIVAAKEVPASAITGSASDDGKVGYMYYINDGTFGSFNAVVSDDWVVEGKTLFPPLDTNVEFPSMVWGPTCDSADLVEKSKSCPRLRAGDWLFYEHTGAYTSVLATRFNDPEKPDTVYFCSEELWRTLQSRR